MSSHLTIVAGLDYYGRAAATAAAWSYGDRTLTFGALAARATRAAFGLRGLDIEHGRHIAVMLDNNLHYPEVIAGIAKAGLTIVPINTHSTSSELAEILRRTRAAAVITQRRHADVVAAATAAFAPDHAFSIDAVEGFRSWDDLVENSSPVPLPELDESATFCVSFTGGTTGVPKGVMLNHRSRALTFHYMALDFGLGPGRRSINATPLYHGAGMAYGYGFMNAGAHIRTMDRWDPEHFLRLVTEHRPDQLFLVPSQISDLRHLGVGAMRDAGFAEVSTAFATAAPLSDELKNWFVDEFPEIVFADVYGGTEAGVVSVNKTPELALRQRSAGPPWFMTEVKLIGIDGQEVAPGESGELYSRSPYLFNGYLDDPEQTRAVSTPDGFVSAGDVAVQDEDGYLYIVDRAKDMIISGGVNVYPREVEERLLQHPDVLDVAVVGVPHPRWGEELVGIVVSRRSDLSDDELSGFCAAELSKFKVPKRFVRREDLDRTTTGKLQKAALRDWVTATRPA